MVSGPVAAETDTRAERANRRCQRTRRERGTEGGLPVKKAYVRLAVLTTSLMALLLAGGANIRRW